MTSATPILNIAATLGEGAIWDQRDSVLWWVDITDRRLHRFTPATGADRAWSMPSTIGTVVPRNAGGVVVALGNVVAAFDPDSATLTTLAGIDQPEQRFNDGKCDPAGRLWVGAMALDQRPAAGALYRLAAGGALNAQVPGVTISNGIVWSRDGATCWYIDTPTKRIDAFDFDLTNGRLSHRRPAVRFPEGVGYPDGMAIDSEGMLWVAMWEGGAVLRCDPLRGTVIGCIVVPGARDITSCAFGGPDLDVLYITSAGGDRRTAEHPNAGALFSARPGVRGLATHAYAG